MNLLIVDDQVTVVDGLLGGLDWENLGIQQVQGAYSTVQAQEILNRMPIDIMLCDIEMPGEDGLSLIAWMRSRNMDTCVILLTAHAEFSYAQASVRLGAFDYILQPASYEKIATVVKNAVQFVRDAKAERRLTEYGEKYIKREMSLVRAALWGWLTGKQNKNEITEMACQGKLPPREKTISLCLLHVIRWNKIPNWEPELFTYALQNMLEEIFLPFDQRVLVVSMNTDEFAVYVWGTDYQMTVAGIQRQMEFFQRICRQHFHCEFAVYLGTPILAGQSRRVWDELTAMRGDNVIREAGIFLLDRENPQKAYHFFLPQTHDWVERLQGQYPQTVEQEACRLLDELTQNGKMCAQVLRDFGQDFFQVLYLAFGNDDPFWSKTLNEPENYEIYRNAAASVDTMKSLIHLAAVYAGGKVETPEKELRQKIDEYIEAHIAEDIHRDDLAKYVYLNPDYLNRVFKQETGYSLKEYILEKKMALAQKLLRTTRLPVGVISCRVGFTQISHFSATYKKQFGCTPMQERKEGKL